ncbi:hypothetical protein ACVDFE_07010 [Lentzea chajnantorensis]
MQKALATGVPDLRRAYTAIQEGHDLDDIIESGNPSRPPARPARGDDGDDDGPPVFKERVW